MSPPRRARDERHEDVFGRSLEEPIGRLEGVAEGTIGPQLADVLLIVDQVVEEEGHLDEPDVCRQHGGPRRHLVSGDRGSHPSQLDGLGQAGPALRRVHTTAT
jgi:hypothetical protein